MKSGKMKSAAVFMSLIIMLQSCGAYKQSSISVNDAVASKDPVKIITVKGEKLKFKGLAYQDGHLVGVTKDIKTLQKLNLRVPTSVEDPFRWIKLRETAIRSVHVKREKSYRTLQIIGAVLTVGATIYFLSQSELDEIFGFIFD